jgi:hypothetical protein
MGARMPSGAYVAYILANDHVPALGVIRAIGAQPRAELVFDALDEVRKSDVTMVCCPDLMSA